MSVFMHSLLLSLNTHILGANRGIALDKRRSAPSSDMLKPHRMGFSACAKACTFVHHWPVSFGLPLVSRRSATLVSASPTVHQQQPNILMCRDDAVRAAMLPVSSLSLSPSVSFTQPIVQHSTSLSLWSPVFSPAPSFYAHRVNSLSCSAPSLTLSLFSLPLSPHKDLLAWSHCWLEHWSLTERKQVFWALKEID